MEQVLVVEDLHVQFRTYEGIVHALEGVNLAVNRGEILGLVGETGCGKSVCALSILRCLPEPGEIVKGRILLEGENLLDKTEQEMLTIRGAKASMIFQDPTSSLNPVFTIGEQLVDVIRTHQAIGANEALKKAIEILKMVMIPDPDGAAKRYPHQLSRGMRQRVMIAMALSCKPVLLIADEPTTALDVTIQAQILRLINDLREKLGASVLLITHDLGVVSETCSQVAVMYAGKIVEIGDIASVLEKPRHPYTVGLLHSIPRMIRDKRPLGQIRGTIPNLINPPSGCRFHPRCDHTMEICKRKEAPLIDVGTGHRVSCFLYEG